MDSPLEKLQEEWQCPIQKSEIIDPVITIDGHTYEHSAIKQWFQTSNKSPKTGLPLSSKILIPNIAFKSLIEKILIYSAQQTEKICQLQDQNKDLKSRISCLRDQLYICKQMVEEDEEIIEKERKLKKAQTKHQDDQNQKIQDLHKQIQNLQNKIRKLHKQQASQKIKDRRNQQISHKFKEKFKQCQIKISQIRSEFQRQRQRINDKINQELKHIKKISMQMIIEEVQRIKENYDKFKRINKKKKDNLSNALISKNKLADELQIMTKLVIGFVWMNETKYPNQSYGETIKFLNGQKIHISEPINQVLLRKFQWIFACVKKFQKWGLGCFQLKPGLASFVDIDDSVQIQSQNWVISPLSYSKITKKLGESQMQQKKWMEQKWLIELGNGQRNQQKNNQEWQIFVQKIQKQNVKGLFFNGPVCLNLELLKQFKNLKYIGYKKSFALFGRDSMNKIQKVFTRLIEEKPEVTMMDLDSMHIFNKVFW